MPHGKPAGIPCVQLLPDFRCALFGRPERPAVCVGLRPTAEMCGASRDDALHYLGHLESLTHPLAEFRELLRLDPGNAAAREALAQRGAPAPGSPGH